MTAALVVAGVLAWSAVAVPVAVLLGRVLRAREAQRVDGSDYVCGGCGRLRPPGDGCACGRAVSAR